MIVTRVASRQGPPDPRFRFSDRLLSSVVTSSKNFANIPSETLRISPKLLIEYFQSSWQKDWREELSEEEQQRREPEVELNLKFDLRRKSRNGETFQLKENSNFTRHVRDRKGLSKRAGKSEHTEKVANKASRNLRQLWSEVVQKTLPKWKFLLETFGLLLDLSRYKSQFQFFNNWHENFTDLEFSFCTWNAFCLKLSREG